MFKVAHITDLHLGQLHEIYLDLDNHQRFLDVLEDTKKQQPDLYVLGGDYSQMLPNPAACSWLREQLEQLNTPYVILSGNHDSTTQLAAIFSLPLRNGFLEQKKVINNRMHLFLDSSKHILTEDQFSWLEESMQAKLPIVLWMHHPPCTFGQSFMDIKHNLKNGTQLMKLLNSHTMPVDVFSGHYHANLRLTQKNVTVHVCPPTSFYISHSTTNFELENYPPAYQLVLMNQKRTIVIPRYLSS